MVAVVILSQHPVSSSESSDQPPSRCPMYGARWNNVVCGLISGATLAIRRRRETQFVHRRVKMPNASPQAIKLNPRCSGQAHSKEPRTDPGNENMEYRCAFRILCAPSEIRPLSRVDAHRDWSFNSFRAAGTNGRLDFSLSWGTSRDPASWPCKIWSGFRVPRLAKESDAPSCEAQLAGCLKGLAGGPLA